MYICAVGNENYIKYTVDSQYFTIFRAFDYTI